MQLFLTLIYVHIKQFRFLHLKTVDKINRKVFSSICSCQGMTFPDL